MRTKRCRLPPWLLALIGALVLPWAVWVTHSVMKLQIEMEVRCPAPK